MRRIATDRSQPSQAKTLVFLTKDHTHRFGTWTSGTRGLLSLTTTESRVGVFLQEGLSKSNDPSDHHSVRLDSVYYFGSLSALVLYSWSDGGGSSSQGGTAQVFTVSDGHLRSAQKIDWDTQFQAGQPTDSFDRSANTLVIRSAHYIPGDAHCCVSGMDIVTFRWDGVRFAQSGIQTELSEYGKREGKTLHR